MHCTCGCNEPCILAPLARSTHGGLAGCIQQCSRFVGSFKQGKPATALKNGGTQWIEWNVSGNQEVVACMREDAMSGPACGTPFTSGPTPFVDFIKHLEKNGKVNYDIVGHKWEGNSSNLTIKQLEDCLLPLPAQAPGQGNRKPNLMNLSGFVDIVKIKQSQQVHVLHRVVCSKGQLGHLHRVEPSLEPK